MVLMNSINSTQFVLFWGVKNHATTNKKYTYYYEIVVKILVISNIFEVVIQAHLL